MRNAQYRAVNGARPDDQSAEEAAIAEFKIGDGQRRVCAA
jgi:hypothetical protein